jgi:hypothetical protein
MRAGRRGAGKKFYQNLMIPIAAATRRKKKKKRKAVQIPKNLFPPFLVTPVT